MTLESKILKKMREDYMCDNIWQIKFKSALACKIKMPDVEYRARTGHKKGIGAHKCEMTYALPCAYCM